MLMTSWKEQRRNVVFCCLFNCKYVRKRKQKRMVEEKKRKKRKRKRKRKKSLFVIQFS